VHACTKHFTAFNIQYTCILQQFLQTHTLLLKMKTANRTLYAMEVKVDKLVTKADDVSIEMGKAK